MTTIVTPHAWSAGDDATSAVMQTLTDPIAQLQGGASSGGGYLDFYIGYNVSGSTTVGGAGTGVVLAQDTELIDLANGHAPSTGRYVGKNAGYYLVTGFALFPAQAGGRRVLEIRVNGAAVTGLPLTTADNAPNGTNNSLLNIVGRVPLNGTTDYVEMFGAQDSGSSLAVTSRLEVQWVHK